MVPIIRQIRAGQYFTQKMYRQLRGQRAGWEMIDLISSFVNDNYCRVDRIRGMKMGAFNQVIIAEHEGQLFVIKTLIFHPVQRFF